MKELLLAGLIILIVNIPFGYWRANVKKFSLQWFLAIHVPVLLVIGMRFGFHLGFAWYSYLVLVTAFFLGQQLGALIITRVKKVCSEVSSCLVMDLLRCKIHHA